uniref:Uncharacterized protein n=1 Tax=Rhizophora mucronata TaxID=61149 RepID=A0A2P2Q0K1_RHIMU
MKFIRGKSCKQWQTLIMARKFSPKSQISN